MRITDFNQRRILHIELLHDCCAKVDDCQSAGENKNLPATFHPAQFQSASAILLTSVKASFAQAAEFDAF
ncbi:MAG: hypothetical protein ACK5KM_05995 [Hyphomicrobiaceae bacterium]